MQITKITRTGLALVLSVGIQPLVNAESDYPAADFEPYIVFQAPEIAEAASEKQATPEAEAAPAEASPYPAADFQPFIVFQDEALIAAQEKSLAAAKKAAQPAEKAKPEVAKESRPAPTTVSTDSFPVSGFVLMLLLFGVVFWLATRGKNQIISEPVAAPAETATDEDGDSEADEEEASAEEDTESVEDSDGSEEESTDDK